MEAPPETTGGEIKIDIGFLPGRNRLRANREIDCQGGRIPKNVMLDKSS